MIGTLQFIQHVLQLLGAWAVGSWAGKHWRSRRATRRVKNASPNVPYMQFVVATLEDQKYRADFAGKVVYVVDEGCVYINNGSRWVLIPEEPQ